MNGVKKDHTGQSAMLKLQERKKTTATIFKYHMNRAEKNVFIHLFHLHDAAMKAAVVIGGIAGYSWS